MEMFRSKWHTHVSPMRKASRCCTSPHDTSHTSHRSHIPSVLICHHDQMCLCLCVDFSLSVCVCVCVCVCVFLHSFFSLSSNLSLQKSSKRAEMGTAVPTQTLIALMQYVPVIISREHMRART